MKNLLVTLITLFTVMTYAQEQKPNPVPQINVAGEGKIKVAPDQVIITLGVENTGKDATEVKKQMTSLLIKSLNSSSKVISRNRIIKQPM